jgi:N-methylhydantoinase A/acetophenone carboxylase
MLRETDAVDEVVKGLHAEASRDMRGEGFEEDQVSYAVEFFLSLDDGSPKGRVVMKIQDWKDKLEEALARQSLKISGSLEIYSPVVFVHARAKIPHYETVKHELGPAEADHALRGERMVCFDAASGLVRTPIYDRGKLEPGNIVVGPAIVEAADTTYVVKEGWRYTVDHYRNGIFEEVNA